MPHALTRFVFGPFEADELRFELRRLGVVVPLQRRTLEVIFFFLRNRGLLIGKRELIKGPGGGVSVGDSAMYRAVMLARRALADADRESYIVTVRGKGYRFEGEVQELLADSTDESSRLRAESDAPSASEPDAALRHELLGRAEELSRLRRHLDAARSGRGLTVVITGAAGIGKSALVAAFAREARALGVRIAQGRAWEGGGAPALLPWAEIVRALAAPGRDFGSDEWPPGFTELMAQLVPELAPGVGSRGALATDLDQGAHARFRLFEALARFLVTQARLGPLLLELEDLHAADDASVLMLQFLRRSMCTAPLLVVVTLRDGEGDGRACIRELLTGGEDAERLSLRGLHAADVRCLLGRIQGSSPKADTLETVCRLTEGNPLWIGELARAGWLERLDPAHADAPWRSLPVPERAIGWIGERMQGLPDEATRIVQAGAVMGREFSWPFLVEMLQLELPQSLRALRRALETGLIEGVPDRAGEFRFPHALVRDAVYSSVAVDVRYDLHARAVAALAGGKLDGELRRLARLAHHAAAAIPLLGPAPAIEHGLAAARHARQLCSYELAAWHGRQVLAFVELAAPSHPGLRWQAWLALAEADSLAGHASTAMESFEAMMSACLAAEQHEPFACAVLSCFEYLRESAITSPLFHLRVHQALGLCPEPTALRARLLAVQAFLSFFYAPAALRVEQTEEAQRLARALNDPRTLLSVLRNGHFAALSPLALDRAQIRVGEMSALAEAFRDPIARLEAHFWSAQQALDTGDGERFHSEVHAHARLAASIRHPVHLWYAALLGSVQALLAGELGASIDQARHAVRLGVTATGKASADSYGGGQLLALAWLHEGEQRRALFAEVLCMGQRVLSLAPGFFAWRLAALVARFETEGAAAISSEYEAVAAAFDQITEDAYWLLCCVLLAHLAIQLKDAALLLRLQHRLVPLEALHVGVTSLYLGPVSFHLARVAAALAETDSARTRYQLAALAARGCQAVPWQRAAQSAAAALEARSRG